MSQQLKSKDTTIEALDGAIKLKEAEISALKADTAPSIAARYAVMRQHANDMTEESRQTSEKLKVLRPLTATLLEHVKSLTASQRLRVEVDVASKLLYRNEGLLAAATMLDRHIGRKLFFKLDLSVLSADKVTATFEAFANGFVLMLQELADEVTSNMEQGRAIVNKLASIVEPDK